MIDRIGYRVRKFPDGFEARYVKEFDGQKRMWILKINDSSQNQNKNNPSFDSARYFKGDEEYLGS